MKYLYQILIFVALISCSKTRHFEICNVTVEMQDGERAIATNQPRFSWNFESDARNVNQISYRIIAASTEDGALEGHGDLWD